MGRRRWQQCDLDALREPDFLLEPFLVRPDFFVQPCVLDRHGRLAGQEGEDFDVTLAERIELGALEIDHSDAAILEEHRDRKLGPDIRNELDIARVLRDVRHEHRFLVQGRVADQAFAETDARDGDLLAVLDRQLHLELAGLVQEQDPEGAIVDDVLGQLRDSREELIEIEQRRDFAADLGERLERVGIPPAALVQPRVDQCDCDVRRELADDRDVALGELAPVAAQDVERTQRTRLVQQRHDHRRVHVRHEADIAGIRAEIAHEQRLLRSDRRADQPLSELEAYRRVPLRVADHVRAAQLAAPFVE